MAFKLFGRRTRAVEVSPVRAVAVADQVYRYIAQRLPHCPLTAFTHRQFAGDPEAIRLADQRCQTFLLWCARRTIQHFCARSPRHVHMAEANDRALRHFIEQRTDGSTHAARELISDVYGAFERFDAAMQRDEPPGPAHWLGRVVLDYVTQSQFHPHGPNDMMMFSVPAEIMRGVDQNINTLLSRTRG